jgi:hypothetical protein
MGEGVCCWLFVMMVYMQVGMYIPRSEVPPVKGEGVCCWLCVMMVYMQVVIYRPDRVCTC